MTKIGGRQEIPLHPAIILAIFVLSNQNSKNMNKFLLIRNKDGEYFVNVSHIAYVRPTNNGCIIRFDNKDDMTASESYESVCAKLSDND